MTSRTCAPRLVAAICTLAAVLLPAAALADETFRDEEMGVTITFPRGWTKVDKAKVAAYPIQKPAGGDAAYLAGYTKSGTGNLTYPFVLIEARRQAWSIGDAKPSEIRAKLNLTPLADLQKSGQYDYKERYKGDGLSPAAFDTDNYRILVQGVTIGPDGKGMYLHSVNYLGADDMVRVNCFAKPEDTNMHTGDFAKITSSFAFDPGAAYDPPRPPPRSRYGRRGPIGGGLLGVGVLVYLLRRWAAD